jgi:hypothetical protein
MKESEFWTKYFQSLRFYKEQRVSTISTQQSDDVFMKVACETDKEEGKKRFCNGYIGYRADRGEA